MDVRNCVMTGLDLVGPRGEDGDGRDAAAVLRRLRELKVNVDAAKAALKGQSPHRLWPFHGADAKVCAPP